MLELRPVRFVAAPSVRTTADWAILPRLRMQYATPSCLARTFFAPPLFVRQLEVLPNASERR
jgi:hypothetical protein